MTMTYSPIARPVVSSLLAWGATEASLREKLQGQTVVGVAVNRTLPSDCSAKELTLLRQPLAALRGGA